MGNDKRHTVFDHDLSTCRKTTLLKLPLLWLSGYGTTGFHWERCKSELMNGLCFGYSINEAEESPSVVDVEFWVLHRSSWKEKKAVIQHICFFVTTAKIKKSKILSEDVQKDCYRRLISQKLYVLLYSLRMCDFTSNSPATKTSIKQKNIFPILVSDLHFFFPFICTVYYFLGEGNPQSVGKQRPA